VPQKEAGLWRATSPSRAICGLGPIPSFQRNQGEDCPPRKTCSGAGVGREAGWGPARAGVLITPVIVDNPPPDRFAIAITSGSAVVALAQIRLQHCGGW